METVVGICLGVGLSAACGFRVFVPLLIVSAASLTGHLDLSDGFRWMASYPALILFATATVVEVCAYYIPWVDNALDTISGPTAVVAGTLVAASQFTEIDALYKWALAVIAGGGSAGLVKGVTALTRAASSATTGGLANPIVATLELGASLVTSGLALVAPVLVVAAIATLVIVLTLRLRRRRNLRPT